MKITGIAWNHLNDALKVRLAGVGLDKLREDADAATADRPVPVVPRHDEEVKHLKAKQAEAKEELAQAEADASQALGALDTALASGLDHSVPEARVGETEAKVFGIRRRVEALERLTTDAKAKTAQRYNEDTAKAEAVYRRDLRAELQSLSDEVAAFLKPRLPRVVALLDLIGTVGLD